MQQLRSREIFSLLLLSIYLLTTLLAAMGLIAQDYFSTHPELSHLAPSADHLLGTDFLGRDVLARGVQGARISVLVGFVSAGIATLIGTTLGALAGFFGRYVDDLIVWLYSTLDSIPYILLLSGLAFSLGQGVTNLFIVLGLTTWVTTCRLVRAEFLKQRELDYVKAAEALGVSPLRQIFKHILPNLIHITLVQFSLVFIFAVKIEVILSYLGLGVEPGTPSWGIMISDSHAEFGKGVWWSLATATGLMFFLILPVNILTNSLTARFSKSRAANF